MSFEGSAETIGLGAGLDDVRAVGNPVEQGLAQAGVGNHLGPLRERQVSSHDHRSLLGPFSNDLKQEFGAHFRQRHITHFINRDQVVAAQRPSTRPSCS